MAYSWNETIVSKETSIKASHLNEIKTNTDNLRGKVGLGGYSWTNSVALGNEIKAIDWSEVQAAVDQAEDANRCSSVNNSNLSGYQSNNQGDCSLYHTAVQNGG
jgi:hypothetical protein